MKPVATWREEAKFLNVGERRLAYWTTNEADETKPWLLLIHGFPTSSWDWNMVWDALAAKFRLAALDMLGFGLSDKPRNIIYSIYSQADFQEVLLEHLGVGEAHILAHDYGDTVAQELLARRQEGSLSFAIKSVVFLNGGLFPEQHRARPIQKIGLSPIGFLLGYFMSARSLRKSFDKIFGPQTKASDLEIQSHWALIRENGGARVMNKLLQYIPERRRNRERWVSALQRATIPLRLIDGGADPVSGAHLYHHYRKLIPMADAILLETIGHYPQTEAPAEVLRAFSDFHASIRTDAQIA
jgi:pimeloyl-ACP methyl ester carboxylesterase